MQNPKVMLLKIGRLFRAVVVGDTYQGPMRGYRLIPGQPRAGLRRADAIRLAEQWDASQALALAGQKVGSYVNPRVKARLVDIEAARAMGGQKFERGRAPRVTIPAPTPAPIKVVQAPTIRMDPPAPAPEPDALDTGARLLERRRAALKMIAQAKDAIAQIDQDLDNISHGWSAQDFVRTIQAGMVRPLSEVNGAAHH